MNQIFMKKQRAEEAPELTVMNDRDRIKRAEPMHNNPVIGRASQQLDAVNSDVGQNQKGDRGGAAQSSIKRIRQTFDFNIRIRLVLRFVGPKKLKLLTQFRGRMNEL